jgi:serine/threonine protein kinase
MRPPLDHNRVLQGRFRVVQLLGQGSCGRTYLVTDDQRFGEPCALKEYFPLQYNAEAIAKSRELFQREAEVLYQIQHDQIPQFRALFEETGQFFLVQDFVAGKSYHQLWQEYRSAKKNFTEAEVCTLLYKLLPVLGYLHSRGIIHRDISLDNILLREEDGLPVLIDFGVVKLDADWHKNPDLIHSTIVGKAGYAPIEQLKTGGVAPHSDLYALAVSAIVLLTGQPPENLFDEMNIAWAWRTYAPQTSEALAAVLDRMLSYIPQQRYTSADEVLVALRPRQLSLPPMGGRRSGVVVDYQGKCLSALPPRLLGRGQASCPNLPWGKIALVTLVAIGSLMALSIGRFSPLVTPTSPPRSSG